MPKTKVKKSKERKVRKLDRYLLHPREPEAEFMMNPQMVFTAPSIASRKLEVPQPILTSGPIKQKN